MLEQTGRQARFVGWVRTAWELIQNLSSDWSFLQGEHQSALAPNNQIYTDASFNVPRFGRWLGDNQRRRPISIYDPAIGRRDESELREITFDQWKARWDFGVHDASRPTEYAIAPDDTLRFGPTPDKAYAIRMRYMKTAQILAANDDKPDLPVRFHNIIVWRAIMLMSDHDEAGDALALAGVKYRETLNQLTHSCLPSFTTSGDGPLDQ